MAAKKKKKEPRPLFDSIRKPTPPPTKRFESEKQERKRVPTLRKTKHRKRISENLTDGDLQ